jgi:hypothetical protein
LTLTLESTVELVGTVQPTPDGKTAPGGHELIVDFWRALGVAPGGDDAFTNRLNEVRLALILSTSSSQQSFHVEIRSLYLGGSPPSRLARREREQRAQASLRDALGLPRYLCRTSYDRGYPAMSRADTSRRRCDSVQAGILRAASVSDSEFATVPRDMSPVVGRRVLRAREFQSREQVTQSCM